MLFLLGTDRKPFSHLRNCIMSYVNILCRASNSVTCEFGIV